MTPAEQLASLDAWLAAHPADQRTPAERARHDALVDHGADLAARRNEDARAEGSERDRAEERRVPGGVS